MARHQTRRARPSRKSGALIWATVLNSDSTILPGATKTGTDIVSDSDWTTVGGQERATILRIRGWFSVTTVPVGALTDSGPIFAYVGMYDADELFISAAVAGTYSDEDIMATWGHVFPYYTIGDPGKSWTERVDIKAMRKIRTGQDLRFVMTNLSSVDVDVSLLLRALIKRS